VARPPQCLSCICRATEGFRSVVSQARQQVRGKKKAAKVTTVKVRLLQNVPRYGREGSIIPVTAGLMRNAWFPRRMAEYMTTAKLAALGKKDIEVTRDSAFGSKEYNQRERERERERKRAEERPKKAQESKACAPQIQIELLDPDQSSKLLDNILPRSIDFYRPPISVPGLPLRAASPSIPAMSAISAAASEGHKAQRPERVSIYGSVSTLDIPSNMKAILAEDNEGKRVVLSPEDISFVDDLDERDRVKYIGSFDIDVRVKGATKAIRRAVTVYPQD